MNQSTCPACGARTFTSLYTTTFGNKFRGLFCSNNQCSYSYDKVEWHLDCGTSPGICREYVPNV